MAMGRMVERLMVLDAVLADPTCTWLGTEVDKHSYFMRRLRERACAQRPNQGICVMAGQCIWARGIARCRR